jgi:hypothetical protein
MEVLIPVLIIRSTLIITTLAVFEKQRAEVLRFVEEFRDWKG